MFPIFMGGVLAEPMGQLLVGLVVLGLLIVVGRLFLRIAWKLVLVAIVVVAALYAGGVQLI